MSKRTKCEDCGAEDARQYAVWQAVLCHDCANKREATEGEWKKHDPHEMLKGLQSLRMELDELIGQAAYLVEQGEAVEKKIDALLNLAELADPLVTEALSHAHGDDGLRWTAIDVLSDGKTEITPRSYSTRHVLREWATVEAVSDWDDRHMVTIYWPANAPMPEWAQPRANADSEPCIIV